MESDQTRLKTLKMSKMSSKKMQKMPETSEETSPASAASATATVDQTGWEAVEFKEGLKEEDVFDTEIVPDRDNANNNPEYYPTAPKTEQTRTVKKTARYARKS